MKHLRWLVVFYCSGCCCIFRFWVNAEFPAAETSLTFPVKADRSFMIVSIFCYWGLCLSLALVGVGLQRAIRNHTKGDAHSNLSGCPIQPSVATSDEELDGWMPETGLCCVSVWPITWVCTRTRVMFGFFIWSVLGIYWYLN